MIHHQKLEKNLHPYYQNHQSDVEDFKDDFHKLFDMSTRSIQYLKYAQNYMKSMQIAFDLKCETAFQQESIDRHQKFCSIVESSSKNNTANTTMVSISGPDRQDDYSQDFSPSHEDGDQIIGPSCFSMASFLQVPISTVDQVRSQQLIQQVDVHNTEAGFHQEASLTMKNEFLKVIRGTIDAHQMEIMRIRCDVGFLKSKESLELLKNVPDSDSIFAQEYEADGLISGEFRSFMDASAQELIHISMSNLSDKVQILEKEAQEATIKIQQQQELINKLQKLAYSEFKCASERVDLANTNDQSSTTNLGSDCDFALQKRSRQNNNSRRGFNGIGPRIDTNLDEARRLAEHDKKLKKQKEYAEILSQQIEASLVKSNPKESANKIKTKLILDINNSNWKIACKQGQQHGNQGHLQGVRSAKNANLTPRMTTFDFSINNTSETTGFQTPLTCKKKGDLKQNLLGMSNDFQKNYQNYLELNNGSTSQRVEMGLKNQATSNSSQNVLENEFGTLSPRDQTILQTRYKHLMNELTLKKKSVDLSQFQMNQLMLPGGGFYDQSLLSSFSAQNRQIQIDKKVMKLKDIQISEGQIEIVDDRENRLCSTESKKNRVQEVPSSNDNSNSKFNHLTVQSIEILDQQIKQNELSVMSAPRSKAFMTIMSPQPADRLIKGPSPVPEQ